MRFIVRIPTKDVGVTLEATAKAPNWRDALKRVLRETGGDEYLLQRAHIHIRRDGRIVVEDPETLRVYELRSEVEDKQKVKRGAKELSIPTKKPMKRLPEKPKRDAGQERRAPKPDLHDGRTAIGTPVLRQGADGKYFESFAKPQGSPGLPSAGKPGDTSPKIADALPPAASPSQSPNQAGFQPILTGREMTGDDSNAEPPPPQEEIPSVIVNLPGAGEASKLPKAVLKAEGSYVEISAREDLEQEVEESSLPEEEPPAQQEVTEPASPPVVKQAEQSVASAKTSKRRQGDSDRDRQDVPVMKAGDNFEDVRSGRTLEVVAGTFLRAVRKRLKADLGVVLVPDSRCKYVLISAGFGLPKNFKARRFKYGDGAGGFACEYESPIQLDDPSSRPELIGKFEALFPEAVSIVAFPVRVPNETFGAIEIIRTEGSAFTQEEYKVLEKLCEVQASKIG